MQKILERIFKNVGVVAFISYQILIELQEEQQEQQQQHESN